MISHFDWKKVRIKTATHRNKTKLLQFIKAYYLFDRIPFDRRAIASSLLVLLNDPTAGRAWFILNRGKPVGYVILTFGFDLEFGGRQATLTDLYIEAPHRKMGIGRMVLAQVEEFCRTRGVKAIELQVTSKNAGVLDFYRRVGFQTYDRIPLSKRIAFNRRSLKNKARYGAKAGGYSNGVAGRLNSAGMSQIAAPACLIC